MLARPAVMSGTGQSASGQASGIPLTPTARESDLSGTHPGHRGGPQPEHRTETFRNHRSPRVGTAMSKTAKTMIVSLLVGAAMFGAAGGAMAADHQPPRAASVIAADTPGSTSQPADMTWG